MKLAELQPRFLRYEEGTMTTVFTLEAAQGVRFLCPKCLIANKGRAGTHGVVCWSRSRGVPENAAPSGRWILAGSGLDDLTLNAEPGTDKRSIQLLSGCMWHGYITRGEVTDA
jgi:hypothetical protein